METLMIAELEEQSATETQALTHSQVRLFLRQRFPFLMIDQVLSIELGERVVGIKNVSGNEPHFIGHFPDQPIMPGVLIIESMAQTASFLGWREGIGGQSAPMQYLASANVSFHQLVMPGDQLVNEIREKRKVGNLQIVSAISRVGEKVVARGELVLATGVSA